MEENFIPREVVLEYLHSCGDYSDWEIMVMFAYHKDHPITEDEPGSHKYRWLETLVYNNELGNDPNQIGEKYSMGEMTQEEYMNYNRQIGYSLYGYWEVFCFNDRFDEDQYEEDMAQLKIENRDKILGDII